MWLKKKERDGNNGAIKPFLFFKYIPHADTPVYGFIDLWGKNKDTVFSTPYNNK